MSGAVLLNGGNSHVFDENTGQFINAKHQRIAEIIADFDPSLRLLWIPTQNRDSRTAKPYAIGQYRDNLPEPYIIFYLTEAELDHRVIAKLFRARQMAEGRPGSLAKALEDAERLVELKAEQQRLEDAEIAKDKARFLWNTPLHDVRMDGKRFRL